VEGFMESVAVQDRGDRSIPDGRSAATGDSNMVHAPHLAPFSALPQKTRCSVAPLIQSR
jgi:hypothetical protein